MTDFVDEMRDHDASATHGPPIDEIMWISLETRARELALKSALRAHGPTPGDRMTTSNIIFTAQAFYDFLTGESDALADSTEQPQ